MKALLLYNPKAGRGKAFRNIELVAGEFRNAGYRVVLQPIVFGENPFDGHEDTSAAIVAGGDGTINYIVNRMNDKGLDLAVGIIPSGTANDFAGVVGMSKNPVEAARQIIGGQERRLDCGSVNGLLFVNIFSFGLFTTTSQRTPDEVKHRIGKLAYIIEGIKELRALHPLPLHVAADDREFDTDIFMALIFNGETAGGFRLARTASVSDGLFDVLMLERRNFFTTCWNMVRYLCGGRPSQVRAFKTRNLSITTTAGDILTDVDGQKGASFPLDIRCHAQRLRIIAPR